MYTCYIIHILLLQQKLYGNVYLCPSQLLMIYSRLELRGKQMVSYVPQVREEQVVKICLCVCVNLCVAPPMIVGAWRWQ